MKRLVVFITVLALILSISATAFAAEQNMQLGSKDIEVTAKLITTTTVPTVYSVDIQWDSMIFTYTETIRKTWKPENHSYEKDSDKKWDETTAQITVTNHSNAAVNVAMTYTAEDGSG